MQDNLEALKKRHQLKKAGKLGNPQPLTIVLDEFDSLKALVNDQDFSEALDRFSREVEFKRPGQGK